MRIAFIGQKGLPAKAGGIDKYVEEIAVRMAKLGHEVFAYARKGYAEERIAEYKGVKLIYIPDFRIKYLDKIMHKFLSSVHALFCKYDIIHYHGTSSAYLAFVSKILEWHTPVVGTIHSNDYYHQTKGIFGDGGSVSMVSEIISQLGLRDKKYVLYQGKLEKKSGVHFLIEAFKQLEDTAKTPNNFKLVIIGKDENGSDYEKLLRKISEGRDNIIFVEEAEVETIEDLFCHAYMFIEPATGEVSKLPLLRAMGHGIAVLVSDTRQNKKIVGKDGFIFESKSIQSLKDNLAYLLSRVEKVEAAGQKARKKIEELYGWGAIVKKTIKVYELIISEKHGKIAKNAK